jgi:hypothetical protein
VLVVGARVAPVVKYWSARGLCGECVSLEMQRLFAAASASGEHSRELGGAACAVAWVV